MIITCEEWLKNEILQPCGDCHDPTGDCWHCKDCDPKEFIVYLDKIKFHTACTYFEGGTEKITSDPSPLTMEVVLSRVADNIQYVNSDQTPHPDDRKTCRWLYETTTEIPLQGLYTYNGQFPDSSSYVHIGDICECYYGETKNIKSFFVELQVTGNSKRSTKDVYGIASFARLIVGYKYDNPLNIFNLPNFDSIVYLFNRVFKLNDGCFDGGIFTINNKINWTTLTSETKTFNGRICSGNILWRACNRLYLDNDNPAAPYLNPVNVNPNVPIGPIKGYAPAELECPNCMTHIVPLKIATDEFRNNTVIISNEKHVSLPVSYNGVWKGLSSYPSTFFRVLQNGRLDSTLKGIEKLVDGGNHHPQIKNVTAKDISLTGMANNLLEQPGYSLGQQISKDAGLIDRGLLPSDTYKTVVLEIGPTPTSAGVSEGGTPSISLYSEGLKNKFIKELKIAFETTTEISDLPCAVHLKFRNTYNNCEKLQAQDFINGLKEPVIDNIACAGNLNNSLLTIPVNLISTDFIEVVGDFLASKSIIKAEATVLDAEHYLSSVVKTKDYSVCFDSAGSLIVFYKDTKIQDCWSSSSQSSVSQNLEQTSESSESSELNDCYKRGTCDRRLKSSSSSTSQSSNEIIGGGDNDRKGGGGGGYGGGGKACPECFGGAGPQEISSGSSASTASATSETSISSSSTSLGITSSSSSSTSSSSSSSSSSTSSLGCPKEYNYNCADVFIEAPQRIALDLTGFITKNTLCRKCAGCGSDEGLLTLDLTSFENVLLENKVCTTKDCTDPTIYVGKFSVSAVAIGCNFNCSKPLEIELPVEVVLKHETGRWTLDCKMTDVDGTVITLFFGSHWDSAKLPYLHCEIPKEGFRSCLGANFNPVECDECFYKFDEISALVSKDLGKTWLDYKGIYRTVGMQENLSYPVAVYNPFNKKVLLYFRRSNFINNKMYECTLLKEIFVSDFNENDAFVEYERPEFFGGTEPNDYFLEQFSQNGKDLRARSCIDVGGSLEQQEVDNANLRIANGLIPRIVAPYGANEPGINNRPFNFNPSLGTSPIYVDRKGIMRFWLAIPADGSINDTVFFSNSIPNQTGESDIIDYLKRIDIRGIKNQGPRSIDGQTKMCEIPELSLIISGITDEYCRCQILNGVHTLVGTRRTDLSVNQPNKYNMWYNKYWKLFQGERYWFLLAREDKLALIKPVSKNHEVCPPNGDYRHFCGTCNGWIVGTVSGSQTDQINESSSSDQNVLSSESSISTQLEEPFHARNRLVMIGSGDSGRTWNIFSRRFGDTINFRVDKLIHVVYDENEDKHYIFYTTPEEYLFMKIISSGALSNNDFAKCDMDVPIFIAGNKIGEDFGTFANIGTPEDFVMNFKVAVNPQGVTGSTLQNGGILFVYVDPYGKINTGIWNENFSNLVAKMQRKVTEQ